MIHVQDSEEFSLQGSPRHKRRLAQNSATEIGPGDNEANNSMQQSININSNKIASNDDNFYQGSVTLPLDESSHLIKLADNIRT